MTTTTSNSLAHDNSSAASSSTSDLVGNLSFQQLCFGPNEMVPNSNFFLLKVPSLPSPVTPKPPLVKPSKVFPSDSSCTESSLFSAARNWETGNLQGESPFEGINMPLSWIFSDCGKLNQMQQFEAETEDPKWSEYLGTPYPVGGLGAGMESGIGTSRSMQGEIKQETTEILNLNPNWLQNQLPLASQASSLAMAFEPQNPFGFSQRMQLQPSLFQDKRP
ncbi:hypothetical protein CRG98_031441 [Punica granatum]|nr:hypothetical protein CRG98_031441 [Punica granatum]